MLMESVAVLTVLGLMTSVECNTAVYVHELYKATPNTNRSWACGICDSRGGHLARRPVLDDWEIAFGNLSHLETRDYWLDLVKTDIDEWYWGDGEALNMSHLSSLPMTPDYNQTYSSWTCAVWNMAEPFLMPANCSEIANVLCEVPITTESKCMLSKLEGTKLDDSTPGLQTPAPADTYANCQTSCDGNSQCWAADYNNDTKRCRTLISSTRPVVPTMTSDSAYAVLGRTCVKYRDMPDDSSFVCNCAAITLPETEAEIQKFVEDYKEEVKKELVVPKDTLGATVRKKVSVADERKSSTGIGALGIAMMAIVFGGLILLDLTTVFAHIKMAANNVRVVFTGEPDSSDA